MKNRLKTAAIALVTIFLTASMAGCLGNSSELEAKVTELEAENSKLEDDVLRWQKKAEEAGAIIEGLEDENRQLKEDNKRLSVTFDHFMSNATYTFSEGVDGEVKEMNFSSLELTPWMPRPEKGQYLRVRSDVALETCFRSQQNNGQSWCNMHYPIDSSEPLIAEFDPVRHDIGEYWFDEISMRPYKPGPANVRIWLLSR